MHCRMQIIPNKLSLRTRTNRRRVQSLRSQGPAVVRSGLRDEVEQYNTGKSPVEQLSGETNTLVTDVMDIDRTPELLAWLFSGFFGGKGQGTPPPPPPGDTPLVAPATSSAPASPRTPAPTSPTVAAADTAAPSSRRPPSPERDTAELSAGAGDAVGPAVSEESEGSPSEDSIPGTSGRTEVAVVGGGCFWCTEACFRELQGVVSVTSGYAGGHVANPTYKQVLTKTTGHAEVVRIEYDPAVLSYRDILQVFLSIHDPTTPNRSGNDVGPQYRSIVLTSSEEQQRVAQQVLSEANRGLWFGKRICTELAPLEAFYPAEAYHQRYYSRNPGAGYCVLVVRPKLQEFRRKYAKRLRQDVSVGAI